jgi:hypothetical protein
MCSCVCVLEYTFPARQSNHNAIILSIDIVAAATPLLLMGMLLVAIAVQMFMGGVAGFLKHAAGS